MSYTDRPHDGQRAHCARDPALTTPIRQLAGTALSATKNPATEAGFVESSTPIETEVNP